MFVAGDCGLCQRVKAYDERIVIVPTNLGRGESVLARHPEVVLAEIRDGVAAALADPAPVTPLPQRFALEVEYKETKRAWRGGLYPGARLVSDRVVLFESEQWLEVMRALEFIV